MRVTAFCICLGLAIPSAAAVLEEEQRAGPAPAVSDTSTEWRNEGATLDAVRLINEAYAKTPFSREFEGVLDQPPLRITWQIGPNVPVAWKGGVAGLIGDDICLAGGLWMPSRANLAYAFNLPTQTYRELPPPPVSTEYTQGACDGSYVYLVGGRGAGRTVYRLGRSGEDAWQYEELPLLPEAEGAGRWVASVALVPGQWLFLVGGHPTGTPTETRDAPALPDYRLRLDVAGANWELMAPYPGGPRALMIAGTARGKLYVFGGSHPEPTMRKNHLELAKKYGLTAPWGGVPNYRDAYQYEPGANSWKPIRSAPFPVVSGCAVALQDRYILLMGSTDVRTLRVGKTTGRQDPFWTGYGDRILCYDVEQDNYSNVGVMPYGVATAPWVACGDTLYGFGGEPAHSYNANTENVLQIGTIEWLVSK